MMSIKGSLKNYFLMVQIEQYRITLMKHPCHLLINLTRKVLMRIRLKVSDLFCLVQLLVCA